MEKKGGRPGGEEGCKDRWRRRVSCQVVKKGVKICGEEGCNARRRRRVSG